MQKFKYTTIWLFLFPIAFLLNLLASFNPVAIERYYALGFNKLLLQFLSGLTGLLPFSLTELLLYALLFFCLVYTIRTLGQLIKKRENKKNILLHFILKGLCLTSALYFSFTILWGLNYNRPLLSESFALSAKDYTVSDLAELYTYLVQKTNHLRLQVQEDGLGYMQVEGGYNSVFDRSQAGYDAILTTFPTLSGHYGRPKPILASPLMNYTGITGIFSPFTAEANVNIAILDAFLPVTTTHEMAHQRGYANEDECNFIAFLVCHAHPDADFTYSGYLLALIYTHNALLTEKYPLLSELNGHISPEVQADINHQTTFWESYKGPIDKISSTINDTYLKANGIKDGEKSYGRMVELLLAYYKQSLKTS